MLHKTRENFRMAFSTLLASKTRAALTMLGIMIGIASVVLLLSIGQAFESYIVKEFNSFGSNIVAVFGNIRNTAELSGGLGGTDANQQATLFENLSWTDYEALSDRSRVPDASIVSPMAMIATNAKWEDNNIGMPVIGVTETYNQAVSLNLGQVILNQRKASVRCYRKCLYREAYRLK